MKEKTLLKSSEKVAGFLDKNSLHKKDFAEMIGVTLSYVYNLIDNTIPFSTRSTTLERISTVMDINPEEFEEYKIPQEPVVVDNSVKVLKDLIRENNLSVIEFLKNFPRKKRLQIVDILRGVDPLPIDYTFHLILPLKNLYVSLIHLYHLSWKTGVWNLYSLTEYMLDLQQ